jgi:hypothetical protein
MDPGRRRCCLDGREVGQNAVGVLSARRHQPGVTRLKDDSLALDDQLSILREDITHGFVIAPSGGFLLRLLVPSQPKRNPLP